MARNAIHESRVLFLQLLIQIGIEAHEVMADLRSKETRDGQLTVGEEDRFRAAGHAVSDVLRIARDFAMRGIDCKTPDFTTVVNWPGAAEAAQIAMRLNRHARKAGIDTARLEPDTIDLSGLDLSRLNLDRGKRGRR